MNPPEEHPVDWSDHSFSGPPSASPQPTGPASHEPFEAPTQYGGPPVPLAGPPPPPAPPEGLHPYAAGPPPRRRLSTISVLALVGGGLLALCCVGGVITTLVKGDKPASESVTNQPVRATGNGTARSDDGASTTKAAARLNQPVRDGKFEFTVTQVRCGVTKVGSQYMNKTAQGQFCLVTVRVKNIGDEARTFSGSNQKATGPGAVSYETDGTAEMYANEKNETFLNDINPGNQVTGVIVFDIPKSSRIVSLELHDSAFSGGVSVSVD